jgi:hypothetical protein
MPSFTKRIYTPEGHPDFIFNRIYSVWGLNYFVSVKDCQGHNCYFTMEEKQGGWKIKEPSIPAWISKVEDQLADAISAHIVH